MNYSELHYILCIAKHQNLTRAAQELYISQPTLTKHLQKLEREMGAKLFSRNGNTYVPTYTGRKYMEYARKILQVKQDWEKELKDLTENNEGELNIAVPLMRSSCMIPQIMAEFLQGAGGAQAITCPCHPCRRAWRGLRTRPSEPRPPWLRSSAAAKPRKRRSAERYGSPWWGPEYPFRSCRRRCRWQR